MRRDVTTKTTTEATGAFGNDYVRGGLGQDDVYGTLGNDWLEGNENEDAIVGDMGKVVDNVLGADDAVDPPDPPQQFIVPNQPFLGATINQTGVLKREVTLYAFNQSLATAGIGHDVALGGDGNDWIHTGPGEDLANGNAGDDRIFLGDNFTATTAGKNGAQLRLAHDRVDAGWGGLGYDHVWGGYGADYSDVRPRKSAEVPGLLPASDPETWYQVAGAGPRWASRRRRRRSCRTTVSTTRTATTTSATRTTSTAAGIRTRCRRTSATTGRTSATACSTGAAATTATTSARRPTATGSRRGRSRRV